MFDGLRAVGPVAWSEAPTLATVSAPVRFAIPSMGRRGAAA